MKSTLNKHRVNNLLRGILNSIALFESQGHTDVYFTAQFYRGGRKQNGIERGDLHSFRKQIHTYIDSEDADAARIEFLSERTGKTIYSKSISDLRKVQIGDGESSPAPVANGLAGFAGLGEVQILELVDRKVIEHRRMDELQRLHKELEEKCRKIEELSDKNQDLESKIKAKSEIEFYSGIIGAAFPGLAPLFNGTPLAQAASFLVGTGEEVGKMSVDNSPGAGNEENQSLAALINEFCATLNPQEQGAIQLLFMALEADRSKIQAVLQLVTAKAA